MEILRNMACTLDGSYIQNADPLILEKLKACNDFSASQVAAMETLLLSGTTQYGYNDKNKSFCQEFKKTQLVVLLMLLCIMHTSNMVTIVFVFAV